jgi:cation diffusion facilitator CzcD-associated flavoprotein CzcO
MQTDYDVLIVGAGISGIGAACHLEMRRPGTTYAVLEARDGLGGTWHLFRYPGIRSDSDLHTFGYEFKPWTSERMIAGADEIRAYLQEAADEHGVTPNIRLRHKVIDAEWSSADGRWTVRCEHDGEPVELTARWLFGGTGYYDHEEGFRPRFEGEEEFAGRIIHPQAWPEDLDHDGKRVVVIGSGATAVTIIPAMAERTAHITMLQRSPGYIVSVPSKDPLANAMRRVLPEKTAYELTRRMHIRMWRGMWNQSKRRPDTVRRVIRALTKAQLPKGHPVDVDFKPRYNPWDERLCAVPDGDLFKAIKAGRASVVTDRIARFTPRGILLESGRELEADIIVAATGLNMKPLGGLRLRVDGEPVVYANTTTFRAMMLTGVPNFAYAMGYTNISWTLKVDLVCEHFCRLLDHMDRAGHDVVVPELDDPTVERELMFDGFQANYMQRSVADWPRQGSHGPWTARMDFAHDRVRLRQGGVEDPALRFGTVARRAALAA